MAERRSEPLRNLFFTGVHVVGFEMFVTPATASLRQFLRVRSEATTVQSYPGLRPLP